MNEYRHNLRALKKLIDRYTIADLKTMIYDVPIKDSGGCCYPAVQTLISLMELIGKICRHNLKEKDSFEYILQKMGMKYQQKDLANNLYNFFRQGIAHNSLAKGGVFVKKDGDTKFHLTNSWNNVDVRIMFEDFKQIYTQLFDKDLLESSKQGYYQKNLEKVLKELNLPWLDLSTPNFFDQLPFTTTSGTLTSGVSGIRGPTTFKP